MLLGKSKVQERTRLLYLRVQVEEFATHPDIWVAGDKSKTITVYPYYVTLSVKRHETTKNGTKCAIPRSKMAALTVFWISTDIYG